MSSNNPYLFIKMRTTQVPQDHCPHCGYLADRQTNFDGETPKPGDISICLKCAAVNLLSPDLKLILVPDNLLAQTFSMETLVEIKLARHAVLQLQSVEKKLERRGRENRQ